MALALVPIAAAKRAVEHWLIGPGHMVGADLEPVLREIFGVLNYQFGSPDLQVIPFADVSGPPDGVLLVDETCRVFVVIVATTSVLPADGAVITILSDGNGDTARLVHTEIHCPILMSWQHGQMCVDQLEIDAIDADDNPVLGDARPFGLVIVGRA